MPYSVLHVDASHDSLEFMQKLLEMERFNIITCEYSHASLEILENTQIDCLITDLQMPILAGNELINIVRKKFPKLPIIVLAEHIQAEEQLLAQGVYATLQKPAKNEIILDTIHGAIEFMADRISFSFNHLRISDIQKSIYHKAIQKALRKTYGNKVKASKMLGISRQTLLRHIKSFDIEES